MFNRHEKGPVEIHRDAWRAKRARDRDDTHATNVLVQADQAAGAAKKRARKAEGKQLKKQIKASTTAAHEASRAKLLGAEFVRAAEAEARFCARLGDEQPELLVNGSPWRARLVGVGVLAGAVTLCGGAYAALAPSHEDALTRALERAGIDATWALATAQMLGITVLGYAAASMLSHALVRKGRDGRPLVAGPFTQRTYAAFAGLICAIVLAAVFCVAELRVDGDATAAAFSASGPAGVGSLGAPAAAPGGSLAVYFVLTSLEFFATIAAFLVLNGIVARVRRGLQHNTDKARKRFFKALKRVDRAEVKAQCAEVQIDTILAAVGIDVHNAGLEGVRLASITRGTPLERLPDGPEILPTPLTPVLVPYVPLQADVLKSLNGQLAR